MAAPDPHDARQGPSPERRHLSFVLTLWLEPTGAAERPEWRWRVREPETGRYRYFRSVRDVLAYVGEQSGVAPPR